MARCKRCGSNFDYDKHDGVCPRCCFYNRPPGTPDHDQEWFSSYNVEDNSYQLPKSIIEKEEDSSRGLFHKARRGDRRRISTDRECRTEGSHVHKTWDEREEKGQRRSKLLKRIFLVTALVLLGSFLATWIGEGLMKRDPGQNKSTTADSFEIEERTASDLAGGIRVEDYKLTSDGRGAVVLFPQGSLEAMPPGEKCIGIYLSDNASEIGYDGIHWQRPYVYDGTNYRKLVQQYYLGQGKGNLPSDTKFISEFIYPDKDSEGLAAYFIDKDAQSVTLCIPKQIAKGKDRVICKGVVQIELPVTEPDKKGE